MLFLREVRLSDINENYYKWMNDPDVTQFLESRFHVNSLESIENCVALASTSDNVYFFAIVLLKDDIHIGNVKLGPDWIHRTAEVGILIGRKDLWGKVMLPKC
jgi:RimJ/RimL family protein N-acetyltransferase